MDEDYNPDYILADQATKKEVERLNLVVSNLRGEVDVLSEAFTAEQEKCDAIKKAFKALQLENSGNVTLAFHLKKTVEELQAELARHEEIASHALALLKRLKAELRWTPGGERVPDKAGIYMVIYDEVEPDEEYSTHGYEYWSFDPEKGWEYTNPVLFWRPLPAPPEVK